MNRRRRVNGRAVAAYHAFVRAAITHEKEADTMKSVDKSSTSTTTQGGSTTGTPSTPVDAAPRRAHRATFSSDKKRGGYLVRVEGPRAGAFLGRTVPVTRKNGDESMEELTKLVWTGVDEENGKPVALYEFKPHAKVKEDVEF